MAKKSLNFATKAIIIFAVSAITFFTIPTVSATSTPIEQPAESTTIDSLSAILVTSIFSALGLGFGIATKSRRNS